MVKVQNNEGPASHVDPESCVAVREGRGEALTGEAAGRVCSRENHALVREHEAFQGADAVEKDGRQYLGCRFGEASWDPAQSETPRMYGCNSSGNREIPLLSVAAGHTDRIGKPQGVR